MDPTLSQQLTGALGGVELEREQVEALASQLLWRIGRVSDEGPVTVRVGLATSAAQFADLPRLRSASDAEVEAAVRAGELRVEWVGARPR
jgi:hypothetical protein